MSAIGSSKLWGKTIVLVAVCGWCLSAQAKYDGGSGAEAEPFRISGVSDWQELMATPADWASHFVLTADIDLNEVPIIPVGTYANNFTGIFDGNDCGIRNADMNMPGSDYVALFGYLGMGGQIRNLGVEAGSIVARDYVGGLVGHNRYGTISNCYSSGGSVEGAYWVGGLVGVADGTMTNCYSSGTVWGYLGVGGLVGSGPGTMTNCYSSGTVWGYLGVGGLVGYVYGTITNCYSSGTVWGYRVVGGVVGSNNGGIISNCYSTGSVTGDWDVGGLVGGNSGTITNCYSSGTVWGETDVGGLAGYSSSRSTVNNSFWDAESSGQLTSAAGKGKTTGEMQMQSTFADAGWDIMGEDANSYGNTWRLCNERGEYPKLSWQYLPGDFLCPDYVDFVDFAYLAGCWLKPECGGADLTFDAIVDALDLTVENDNWLTGMPPGQASNQSPINGATSISTNADLNWTVGSFAASHDLYFGTSSPPPFIRSQTATVFDPGIIAAITKCYWRIDEVNAWGKSVGPVWTFTTGSPDQATNPDPVDGRTGVSNTTGLRWNAGFDAISHDVYFGTANPPPFVCNQAATLFYPDIMSYNTKYYWRIDEVNAGGRSVGTVWTFTTGSGGSH